MRNFTCVSGKWWMTSIMVVLMLVATNPVWADECSDAKRALAIAEADLKVLEKAKKQALAQSNKAKGPYLKARAAYTEAFQAREDAYQAWTDSWEAAAVATEKYLWGPIGRGEPANPANLKKLRESKGVKAKRDAKAAYDKAQVAEKAALEATKQPKEAYDEALAKFNQARQAVNRQRDAVSTARQRAFDACKEEGSEAGKIIGSLMNDEKTFDLGSGEFKVGGSSSAILKLFTGRANEANTEDIAIEEARKRGLDKGGNTGGGATPAASTAVTGSVNCFGSPGQATVSFAGMQVCSSTGGIASVGNAISKTCTPGSTVSFVIACPGATAGPNCHMFVTSLTGVTCTPNVVGVQVNGPGTVNCTCS